MRIPRIAWSNMLSTVSILIYAQVLPIDTIKLIRTSHVFHSSIKQHCSYSVCSCVAYIIYCHYIHINYIIVSWQFLFIIILCIWNMIITFNKNLNFITNWTLSNYWFTYCNVTDICIMLNGCLLYTSRCV